MGLPCAFFLAIPSRSDVFIFDPAISRSKFGYLQCIDAVKSWYLNVFEEGALQIYSSLAGFQWGLEALE